MCMRISFSSRLSKVCERRTFTSKYKETDIIQNMPPERGLFRARNKEKGVVKQTKLKDHIERKKNVVTFM